jgi:hypothetical protein
MVFTGVLSDEWTSEKRKVDSSILSLTTNPLGQAETPPCGTRCAIRFMSTALVEPPLMNAATAVILLSHGR